MALKIISSTFQLLTSCTCWKWFFSERSMPLGWYRCCVLESSVKGTFGHIPSILWGVFGVMLHRMPYFSNFMHRDGSSLDGCKYTIECRVAYIHRKPLQMHIYERQTHLQTRFQCQLTKPSRSSMRSPARGRRCFVTSATKLCHQIEFFVNVPKCMIGKEH